jgi:hypothetical protein
MSRHELTFNYWQAVHWLARQLPKVEPVALDMIADLFWKPVAEVKKDCDALRRLRGEAVAMKLPESG